MIVFDFTFSMSSQLVIMQCSIGCLTSSVFCFASALCPTSILELRADKCDGGWPTIEGKTMFGFVIPASPACVLQEPLLITTATLVAAVAIFY